jgi:hypothetical protein
MIIHYYYGMDTKRTTTFQTVEIFPTIDEVMSHRNSHHFEAVMTRTVVDEYGFETTTKDTRIVAETLAELEVRFAELYPNKEM